MEIFERTFKKIWKSQRDKDLLDPNCCLLRDIEKYLVTILAYRRSKDAKLYLSPSLKTYGVWGDHIYFPDRINFFEDYELNKDLYLYMSLKSLGQIECRHSRWGESRSSVGGALLILHQMYKINRWLQAEFIGFKSFETALLDKIHSRVMNQNSEVYKLWKGLISSCREPDPKVSKRLFELVAKQKRNDVAPSFLQYTVPLYFSFNPKLTRRGFSKKTTENAGGSEKQDGFSRPIKKESLDKEENNPVIHSFEKLETVDEFEKSGRFHCGDDELDKHNSALNEIEMSHMTTDGEISQSSFKADSYLASGTETSSRIHSDTGLHYPEWDEKQQIYLKDYCLLYESVPKIVAHDKPSLTNLERQRTLIWQKKLLQIFNQPIWRRKLLDGSEVDIDSWCRVLSDLKSQHMPRFTVYSEKRVQRRELAISVLFDQSLSTDSWIENKRVIDLIRTSLLGLKDLLHGPSFQVMVSGTYSATRKQCRLLNYKSFNENWTAYDQRILGIEPQGYTRLGPAIRHITNVLSAQAAKKKIFVMITDGKPTDLDFYEGRRGIGDIRKARIEAENMGISFVAIVLDNKNRPYFSEMFRHYKVVHSMDSFQESFFSLLYKSVARNM